LEPASALVAAAVYVLLGRSIIALRSHRFFFWHSESHRAVLFSLPFLAYLALATFQYLALRRWGSRPGARPWLAFLLPIGFLIAVRYTPFATLASMISQPLGDLLQRNPQLSPNWVFVGISYLAFRTSYLVLEVRNGVVPQPNLWQYLGFAFFAPTMSVGPINRYSEHRIAFQEGRAPNIPIGFAAQRVVVGAVKFKFLGPILNQFTYAGLVLDGHPHAWIDLPIAAVAYYVYLYCNFSGFCDIAIGGAGLMGISVAENFSRPFGSRNVKEFWNRWHITLSEYMREVVFSPLARTLVRLFGATRANDAIAATILLVFLLVGIWHGVGWHYAAFGLSQGVAVAANHYYTLALKKRLGRERFTAYNRSAGIHAAAVALTFLYTTASIFLFANDWPAMKSIFRMLRVS
jgi:D-alanyl-lipoteichoic acid acyltransferase DltB (MBOAT superfamily)